MDFGGAANAFSTITTLLATYVAEQRAGKQRSIEGFKDWLAEHRHTEVVNMLEQNSATTVSIKAMLSQDREVLLKNFDSLDRHMAAISSAVTGLSNLALAVRPMARLSRQAEALLCKMHSSGASQFLDVGQQLLSGAKLLLPMDSEDRAEITPDDPQFFEDDLHVLRDLGMIRFTSNSQGHRIVNLTRPGAEHAKRVKADGWQTPCPN